MSSAAEHEALVAQFLKRAAEEWPDLYREVSQRHPVLSDRQMRRRSETEIPVSQLQHYSRHLLQDGLYAGFDNEGWARDE